MMTSIMVGHLLLGGIEDGNADRNNQEAPCIRYLGILQLLYPTASSYNLTKDRPVIVAEHMLGCAMYELVRTSIKINPVGNL